MPANENQISYEDLPSEQLPSYFLGRHAVSNSFYQLFDPGHGLRGSSNRDGNLSENDLWPLYADYSDQSATASIYVNFYDAWVYTRFLYWDGLACHLPREDQWECAVKYGFGWEHWDQAYWWGNDFDAGQDREQINCHEAGYGKTLVPASRRANPLTVRDDPQRRGLTDMLGGTWEWCEDPFSNLCDGYQSHSCELFADPSVYRAVRGGSFISHAIHTRCSNRSHRNPADALHDFGCRVARAIPRKT